MATVTRTPRRAMAAKEPDAAFIAEAQEALIDEDYTNWFTGEEAELEEAGQITLPANGYLVLTHGEC